MAVTLPDPCEKNKLADTFFNQPWVMEDLGVPLNFTSGSLVVQNNFILGTGDPFRQDVRHLETMLESGVKVAMVYGDRDYRCNCKLYHFQLRSEGPSG
jgi:Serine carboxypeptidase